MSLEQLQADLKGQELKTRKDLLNLIPFFHGFFARNKDEYSLQIARDLGVAVGKIKL